MRNDDIRRRPDGSIDIGFYARRSARFHPAALRHIPGQFLLGTVSWVRRIVERAFGPRPRLDSERFLEMTL